jgi:nucleoside triphosphate pyrophosphatase
VTQSTLDEWMPPLHLILASASPRRRELLACLGVEFTVIPPAVTEVRDGHPAEVVLANARAKARVVAERAAENSLVLAVDTDVALDGRLLGKAADERGARERLEALSGRTHEVLSGIVVLPPHPAQERAAVESSRVSFAHLEAPALDAYIASGEWRDRAGAYAVQGFGAMLIERVEGDLSNVIGLPLRRLLALAPEILENSNPEPLP